MTQTIFSNQYSYRRSELLIQIAAEEENYQKLQKSHSESLNKLTLLRGQVAEMDFWMATPPAWPPVENPKS
jgi:hypothetical protein